jgi:hypothetical protein
MKLTSQEHKLLKSIATSEYQDGSPLAGNSIWLDYIVDTKALGGVLSSLLKKELVTVDIIPMNRSDNSQNGISDSTVALTQTGVDALAKHF